MNELAGSYWRSAELVVRILTFRHLPIGIFQVAGRVGDKSLTRPHGWRLAYITKQPDRYVIHPAKPLARLTST